MDAGKEPRLDLADKTLAPALFKALRHIFDQNLDGCVLAGGTALAGFYAAHRRSDDLDLFTQDEIRHRAAVLAAQSLFSIGTAFHDVYQSAQYYRAACELDSYSFTITVVQDPNLFRVGSMRMLSNKIRVVDLLTLFKMKAATLVSRCGEKDLYDLIWLFGRFEELTFADLIRLGNEIDAGVTGESLLLGVSGATLNEEACGFALARSGTRKGIYRRILQFRKSLMRGLGVYLKNEPAPPLSALVRKLSKLKNRSR